MRKDPAPAAQMLGTILHGVSTREYKQVLPNAAEAVGVSRSAVSRQVIEASEMKLQEPGHHQHHRKPAERRSQADSQRHAVAQR